MSQFGISSIRFRYNFAVLAMMLFMSLAFGQTPIQIQELTPNQVLEREIRGAETHRYKFDLRRDEFFRVQVEQKGVDVALRLLDASGRVLATMNNPNGKQGLETLSFVAQQAGSFVLELSNLDAKVEKGKYIVKRGASRTATAHDKQQVEVERLYAEAVTESIKELQTALSILQDGQTLANKSRSDSLTARAKLNESLTRCRALSAKLDDKTFIEIISQPGETSQQSLDFLSSLRFLSKHCEAMSLNEIARTHLNLSEWQESIDYLKPVVAVCQEILADKAFLNLKESLFQVKLMEALGLVRIGQILDGNLGQPEESLNYLTQAVERYHALYQEKQDLKFKLQEAFTLSLIGQVYGRESKDKKKAIEAVSKSIEIYRAFPNEKGNVASKLYARHTKIREMTHQQG